ncbi:MAG: hypothetical protein A2W90_15745 [Bacteroidetes bacterium GWF2_42_66]|nr:MAG: hypothetical protein A2W92_08275 [Bacteroidetes bacterium GWA2_42_15]OFY02710.1 MAG: hypothetical protein A2W89_04330 [Bacteroidetes bacterium GWE2_42_39]OFY43909.1 MAG: hypothetical protein A2W90_15745 [Bacteroidetes bacterium GWF2_42_66]HBL77567.1 phosphohydrolase [Prolixibacteraceae bacterium]HCR90658.1 phosphohydrolase [Prolixibacteraceae bacterium]
MRKINFIAAILILIVTQNTYAQYYTTAKTPQRIIINLTETPAISMAVTWRTVDEINKPEVQIAEATNWTEFEKNTRSIYPQSKKFITDKKFEVFQHSAIMDGLKPNTLYVYRVGGDSAWSEWNQFRTAQDITAPFKFIFLGDIQNSLKQHCSRVLREAYKTAPDAAFWLLPGDITDAPLDDQYDELFYAGGFIFGSTPSILTADNHDNEYLREDGSIVTDNKGRKIKSNVPSTMFLEHFTLPENGMPEYKETSYYVDYQGVRMIVINTSKTKKLNEQVPWIEKLLANNPNKWTVVSFHHPFYSAGRDRDEQDTRNAFLPVFDKYNVDLVLTGHDHAYSRSYKLRDGTKVPWNKKGTVYVVSVSGPKMYAANSNYNNIMEKTGGNTQLFQVISVDRGKLIYESYTPTGSLYDSFRLSK